MSRYMMIHRLRWPAVLILAGVIALLHTMGFVDHFWHWFIPLLLIMLGVLILAERAALAADGGFPLYPGAAQAGAPDYRAAANIPTYPGQAEPYIPPQHQDSKVESEGGQL
jgi:hypothetical protein